MVTNTRLAAAIAAVLATGVAGAAGHTPATAPAPGSANSPNTPLYIAGSSAAKNAVLAALETGLCGGSYSLFSSTGNTNFFAVSCTPSASTGVTGANGSNVFTVWYRAEGGSVTGALPIVTGSSIDQLNLSTATGGPVNYTVAVTGSSAINGIDDSFGPTTAVMKEPVQFGITDVEPGALSSDNYPSAYKSSVYGTATATQLSSLGKSALFQQVFGIFVNTKSAGGGFTAAEQASLSLSKATITNILQGSTTDWSLASDTSGNPVTSGASSITIVNREQGSGSRTAASIYFTDDECNAAAVSIAESTAGTADFFSTGNVLSNANTVPGAITYASIDNAGSYANLTLVSINGIYPTNLAAAQGQYDFWYEATGVVNAKTSLTPSQTSLISYLTTAFQTLASAPHASDVLAIPGKGSPANAASLPPTPNGSATVTTIYVNPFTRKAGSCNAPLNSI
jgi:hypothetical protein